MIARVFFTTVQWDKKSRVQPPTPPINRQITTPPQSTNNRPLYNDNDRIVMHQPSLKGGNRFFPWTELDGIGRRFYQDVATLARQSRLSSHFRSKPSRPRQMVDKRTFFRNNWFIYKLRYTRMRRNNNNRRAIVVAAPSERRQRMKMKKKSCWMGEGKETPHEEAAGARCIIFHYVEAACCSTSISCR